MGNKANGWGNSSEVLGKGAFLKCHRIWMVFFEAKKDPQPKVCESLFYRIGDSPAKALLLRGGWLRRRNRRVGKLRAVSGYGLKDPPFAAAEQPGGEGKNAEALPVAEGARRFRGSVP